MRDRQGSQHIAALDGIRGLAVIFVFVFHAANVNAAQTSLAVTPGPVAALFHAIAIRGWIGVDLFFVLSGYLITGILLRAKDAENYYQVFYARRALRILPLYYVVMFGLIAMSAHRPPITSQIWFWFNLSNFPTAFDPGLIPYLAHYWSLAIEEQFYLLWPSMVRRFSEKVLIRICLGAIVGCFVLRNLPIVLAWNQRWPDFVYRLTPFRIDTLCAGALLAILIHRGVDLKRFRGYLRIACIAGGTVLGISLFAGTNPNLPVRLGYTGSVLCFTALIALALDPASLTAKIFRNGFLRRMGWYSYCFYLIHVGVLSHDWMLRRRLAVLHLAFANEELNQMVIHCIAFAVTFGICAASYKFFESPILDLKRFFPYRRRKLSELLPTTAS
jgi:peptidoglycan/LPS O-acetylase OafA/YrhL